ncbi:hypothetical protein [Sulfidibacter corallicola]|uniref:Uncharacterized protein n=1 Tax=Sulfidibacter corallicola TaxID=2818388 RepID=A0A8A4TE45_SULCO|nr:hypothetical protein [Sulfidibacter corallicola]QTD47903.1 hypothetical protein J3U87_20145 [Sulfidibacter corallicola]
MKRSGLAFFIMNPAIDGRQRWSLAVTIALGSVFLPVFGTALRSTFRAVFGLVSLVPFSSLILSMDASGNTRSPNFVADSRKMLESANPRPLLSVCLREMTLRMRW